MSRRLRLLAVLLLGSLVGLGASAAHAFPTLWVARSEQATVYLFGTVHLLPPGLEWRSPQLERALRDSQEVWTETLIPVNAQGAAFNPEEVQRVRQLTLELGVHAGPPLSSRLTPVEAAELKALVEGAGVQPEILERMRPWLAATMVSAANHRQLGWSPTAGADVVITAEAQRAGKPIEALETSEQQLRLLADLPPDVELAFLRQTIAQARDAKARFEILARIWSDGDDDRVAEHVNGNIQATSQELYDRINVVRNRAWLPKIEEFLKTSGVKFVAVGDGHLVGKDGIPALLKARGVRIERVP